MAPCYPPSSRPRTAINYGEGSSQQYLIPFEAEAVVNFLSQVARPRQPVRIKHVSRLAFYPFVICAITSMSNTVAKSPDAALWASGTTYSHAMSIVQRHRLRCGKSSTMNMTASCRMKSKRTSSWQVAQIVLTEIASGHYHYAGDWDEFDKQRRLHPYIKRPIIRPTGANDVYFAA